MVVLTIRQGIKTEVVNLCDQHLDSYVKSRIKTGYSSLSLRDNYEENCKCEICSCTSREEVRLTETAI